MRKEIEDRIERHRYILERLKDGDAVRVSDLAKHFSCSPSTVHSDLRHLRYLGIEIKTRRGIIQPSESKRASLIREISFPPEYKEAGISILSYFSRILEQNYPDIDAGVTITQKGNKVTLKVESDEGELEVIEKALTDYGRVVTGELEPREILSNPIAILELNNRLEIARLELRLKEQAHQAIANQQQERIVSLENQLSEVRAILGTQLESVRDLSQTISHLAKSEVLSSTVKNALNELKSVVVLEHSKTNEAILSRSLETIRTENPSFFGKISASFSSISHSVAANIATPWVVSFINSLPK